MLTEEVKTENAPPREKTRAMTVGKTLNDKNMSFCSVMWTPQICGEIHVDPRELPPVLHKQAIKQRRFSVKIISLETTEGPKEQTATPQQTGNFLT